MTSPQPSQEQLDRLQKAEQMKFLGEHEDALKILEQLILEDPDNITVLEEIADNELSLENFERAEAAAERVLVLDPESARAHYTLGFLASQKDLWDDAVRFLKEANRLESNNPEILRCLGWALFQEGQRLQGIVTLERALNLESDNTLVLCDLGVAYLEIRNFAKAKALLHRALDLDPEDERARECSEMVDRLEKETALRRG